ncbi:MAG: FecR domain-containing protein [Pirellulales bacterium]|nr:FecR domain-containing protein [Pirellulales bacterium]
MNDRCESELALLIDAVCDGTISSAQMERLDAVLRADQTAREYYNNVLFLHGELYSQHASGFEAESLAEAMLGIQHVELAAERREGIGKASRGSSQWKNWLAISIALLGVAAVSSWVTGSFFSVGGQVASSGGSPLPSDLREAGVARVTATRNCSWDAGTAADFGERLVRGQQLKLTTGLVEITFDDGAVVVLEGPATFDVESPGKAQLREGRLAAVVPERARGFEVLTSRLNVVDLGTEFGVMADTAGATEVHVFNGLVKAHLLDDAGKNVRTVELNTAEAARIEPAAAVVARIPARDDEFVRTLFGSSGPRDGVLAYDGFNYPAGPLDEQNGGFGWAGAWFTVESDSKAPASSNGVASGSLDFEGVMPLGNRAIQTAQQNRVRRSLGTSVGGVFDSAGLVENRDGVRLIGRDGSVVYLSFLQRVSKINDVFYGFELHRGDGNGNRVLSIGSGVDETGYGVTSNVNAYGKSNFPSLGQENTAINMFVVRIEFGQDNRDRLKVYRNPASFVEESACRPDAELVGNFAFDRISMGNFNGTKIHEIDEVRVGTTFRAVTGRRGRVIDKLPPRVAGAVRRFDLRVPLILAETR